jgi:hypothetical protein
VVVYDTGRSNSVFVRRSGDSAASWQAAAQGLLSTGAHEIKLAAIPASAVPVFKEQFACHGYQLSYESPCDRYDHHAFSSQQC